METGVAGPLSKPHNDNAAAARSTNGLSMNLTTRHREAEIALGARSRHKAEAELRLVDPARFGAAITEFIEWRTFAYWVRLAVDRL